MYTVEITVDIISAIYLLIIIIGIYNITVEESASTKAYKRCLWVCYFGLFFDALSFFINGKVQSNFWIGLLTYITFILVDVMIVCYSFYIYAYIKEKNGKITKNYIRITFALSALDAIFLTVGTISGKLFTVVDGSFIYGPWIRRIYMIPLICLCIGIICLLRNIKYFVMTDMIIFSLYTILQVVTALLWIFDQYFISSYVTNAIALTIIFVMIQYRAIAETSMQAEIFNTLSIRDALTGLRNRRSYDECLSLVPPEAAVCAVFCDLNFLKKVNDTLGHEAGDNLLKKMADILKEVFADEEIFRISGDEFVVIMQNIEEEIVSERIAALKKSIMENDRIAAFGSAEGKGLNILNVIREAEQQMYMDKTVFYAEVGKNR